MCTLVFPAGFSGFDENSRNGSGFADELCFPPAL